MREWRHEPFLDLSLEATIHAGNVIFQPGMFCEEAFVSRDPVYDTPLAGSDRSGTTTPHHASHQRRQESRLTEYAPQFCIVVDVSWIQVIPDRAFEQSRILWDDGQSAPQIQQPNRRGVQRINAYIALTWLNDSEQSKGQRALPRSGATNNTNLLVGLDIEINALEHEVQAFTIPGAVVVEVHCTRRRPTDWWSMPVDYFGSFVW